MVLAAGEGKRMRPLTLTTPKPLLRFGGQTVLDHLFEALPKEIDEAVMVVKYLGDQIREYCGGEFHGRPVSYATGEMRGPGYDAYCARHLLAAGERFAIVYADEILNPASVARCLEHEYSWLCFEVSAAKARESGVAVLDDGGRIKAVIEKPERPPTNLAANGFMVANADVFNHLRRHENGEYYLSDMMHSFAQDNQVQAVVGPYQPSLTVPEDLEQLNKTYRV